MVILEIMRTQQGENNNNNYHLSVIQINVMFVKKKTKTKCRDTKANYYELKQGSIGCPLLLTEVICNNCT